MWSVSAPCFEHCEKCVVCEFGLSQKSFPLPSLVPIFDFESLRCRCLLPCLAYFGVPPFPPVKRPMCEEKPKAGKQRRIDKQLAKDEWRAQRAKFLLFKIFSTLCVHSLLPFFSSFSLISLLSRDRAHLAQTREIFSLHSLCALPFYSTTSSSSHYFHYFSCMYSLLSFPLRPCPRARSFSRSLLPSLSIAVGLVSGRF